MCKTATPVITLHHQHAFLAGPVNAHVTCPGDRRQSALLEQPWWVFMQLRPAQVGQDSWWMEQVGGSLGGLQLWDAQGPLLKKLLHSSVCLSGPAGGGCDLLQMLWYSCRVLGGSVLGLGTVGNGAMLLSWYTMWGLKVCTVNLRGLFMRWIELASQYFIGIIGVWLALSHVWEMPVRLESQWWCI